MSESVQSHVGVAGTSFHAVECWSDTRDPSNSQPSPLNEPNDYRDNRDRVSAPDLTAVVMLIAMALTAVGLSAGGVIYVVNELLSYSSMDLLQLVVGSR